MSDAVLALKYAVGWPNLTVFGLFFLLVCFSHTLSLRARVTGDLIYAQQNDQGYIVFYRGRTLTMAAHKILATRTRHSDVSVYSEGLARY